MGGLEPTNGGIKVGGMRWEVSEGDDLPAGQVASMNCVEDRGHELGAVLDKTRVVLLEDGSTYVQLSTQAPDGSIESAAHEFPKGALRAIVEHVEQLESANSRNIFSRIMASLTSHASYLRR
jgi:hypothetical protein